MMDLLKMEENMRLRRKTLEAMLRPNERLFTLTSFPLLGVGDFVSRGLIDNSANEAWSWEAARSMFVPDECINSHARFKHVYPLLIIM
jgi:glutamate--cysteine ligase catalytic subunit